MFDLVRKCCIFAEINIAMKIPDKFKEYIWLVNTIRKARRITFAEIQSRWLDTELSEGVELARSTFNRHKDAIQDIFGIYIDCDRRDGYKYYIGNDYVLREDSVQNWMLNTLSVNNIISESLSLQDRILLEQVPCDDHLQMVIDAMKKKVRLQVSYRRYGTDEPRMLDFEPYCIKLFRQRWYVLGHFHRDATADKPESDYYGIFSFDRILDMKETDVKFELRADFDAKSYFDECWGVLAGDGTSCERIVIRAYGQERYYMRDLPMHHSQKLIRQGENYADFQLMMRPTIDFSGHILSRGAMVKVLSPDWLAEEIYNMHIDAASQYEPEDDMVDNAVGEE